MTNPSDQHIADLIATLVSEVERCSFDSDRPKKQELINQIAQLRSSMNPVIIQKITKV
jgi:hypothetical protein